MMRIGQGVDADRRVEMSCPQMKCDRYGNVSASKQEALLEAISELGL